MNRKEQRRLYREKRDAKVRQNYTGNFVYVLVNRGLTHAKIGFTTDVIKRHQAASTFTIWPVSYLCVVPGDTLDEAATHKQWKHLRKHGEWFKLDLDLLDAAKIASMQMGNVTACLYDRGLSYHPCFHDSIEDRVATDPEMYPAEAWRVNNFSTGSDCDSVVAWTDHARHYVHFKSVIEHRKAFPDAVFKTRRIGGLMSWFHEHEGIVFGSCFQAEKDEMGGLFVFKKAVEATVVTQ